MILLTACISHECGIFEHNLHNLFAASRVILKCGIQYLFWMIGSIAWVTISSITEDSIANCLSLIHSLLSCERNTDRKRKYLHIKEIGISICSPKIFPVIILLQVTQEQ